MAGEKTGAVSRGSAFTLKECTLCQIYDKLHIYKRACEKRLRRAFCLVSKRGRHTRGSLVSTKFDIKGCRMSNHMTPHERLQVVVSVSIYNAQAEPAVRTAGAREKDFVFVESEMTVKGRANAEQREVTSEAFFSTGKQRSKNWCESTFNQHDPGPEHSRYAVP